MLTTAERNKVKYKILRAFDFSPNRAKKLSSNDETYINALREIRGLPPINLRTFGEEE